MSDVVFMQAENGKRSDRWSCTPHRTRDEVGRGEGFGVRADGVGYVNRVSDGNGQQRNGVRHVFFACPADVSLPFRVLTMSVEYPFLSWLEM